MHCVSICESLETFGVLPAVPCWPHASPPMTRSSLPPRQLCFSPVVKSSKSCKRWISNAAGSPFHENSTHHQGWGAGSGYRLPSPYLWITLGARWTPKYATAPELTPEHTWSSSPTWCYPGAPQMGFAPKLLKELQPMRFQFDCRAQAHLS